MQAWQATVQDDRGNAIPNPVVTVYEADGTTLASVFNTSGVALANPVTGDIDGFVQFYAGPGHYKVDAVGVTPWAVALGGVYTSYAAVLAADKGGQDAVSAYVGGHDVRWLRESGGPCLGGGWVPSGEVWPHHFGISAGGWHGAINSAIAWVSAGGGGCVKLPHSVSPYTVSSPVVMRSNVNLDLNGQTLILSAGSNCNLIEGLNYQTLTGTNSGSGISEFTITNGIVDGNRAGNLTTGHGIAFYGRNFFLNDLLIKNARQRGLHSEYGNTSVGTSPFNGRVHGLTFDTCGEEGWLNDVSDCQGGNLNFASCGQNADNTFDAMVMVRGSRIAEGAIWRKGIHTNRHRYGVRLMGGSTVTMMNVETSATAAWRLEGGVNQVSDTYSYNNMGASNVQIASSGNRFSGRIGRSSIGEINAATLEFDGFSSNNNVDIVSSGLGGPVLRFTSYSGGFNKISISGSADTAASLLSGVPLSTDKIDISLQVGASILEMMKKSVTFATVSAAGDSQATATELTRTNNRVGNTNGTRGVRLPVGIEGLVVNISNPGTADLNVYPSSGQQVAGSGGINLPYILPALTSASFMFNGGPWILYA